MKYINMRLFLNNKVLMNNSFFNFLVLRFLLDKTKMYYCS